MQENLVTTVQDTASMIWSYVPTLLGALAVLVLGWVAASYLARGVRLALEKTDIAKRSANLISGVDVADAKAAETWIAKGVFVVLMLFVLIGFFQVLGLNQVTQPITGFLNEIFQYLPRLIGPVLLVVIAWVAAKFLRIAVKRGMASTRIDERVEKEADLKSGETVSLSDTVGETVYWLTFLVFLPAILSSLELGGLLGPIRGVVEELLGYLPNLFAAGLILFIGWLVARIVRKIVTNLLLSAGIDRLSERVGLHGALGERTLSGLIGLVVYVLILVPILVAALNAMALDAVTQPASRMLNEILDAVPNIFAGALVLIIAYVVAKVVASLIGGLLAGVGFDSLPQRLGIDAGKSEARRSPSEIVGFVVLLAIMIFAVIEAFRLIGFAAVGDLISQFMVFAGHVIVGLIIIGFGLFLAKVAAEVIQDSKVPRCDLLAIVARVAILVLATAMGLGEMGLGEDIIVLAFGLILGAVAVALAIAFGIGGRDAAAEILSRWSRSAGGASTKPD